MIADDILLAVNILRNGDASPAEQRAVCAKVSALAGRARRIERALDEIVADAMEEALLPPPRPVVIEFPVISTGWTR